MKKVKGLNCILLIDDEETNHFLNKILIKKANIDVHVQTVFDGIEALEFLTSTGKYSAAREYPQPGIVFLDINMPRMNGWEFIEKYKELSSEQKEGILLTMLTSSSNRFDALRAQNIPEVFDYLVKPLTIHQFEKIISDNYQIQKN